MPVLPSGGCKGRHPEQTSDALGAAGSQLGPYLKAWGTWLHYRMGLSFGRVAEVLAHLGLQVTTGAICRFSARAASTELVPVHAELVRRANTSSTITMDESGAVEMRHSSSWARRCWSGSQRRSAKPNVDLNQSWSASPSHARVSCSNRECQRVSKRRGSSISSRQRSSFAPDRSTVRTFSKAPVNDFPRNRVPTFHGVWLPGGTDGRLGWRAHADSAWSLSPSPPTAKCSSRGSGVAADVNDDASGGSLADQAGKLADDGDVEVALAAGVAHLGGDVLDLGLGKTIEAGLIVQELLLRHRARRVIVVCPASLTGKWAAEMADRFGLGFEVLDAGRLKELRRSHGLEANPFRVFPRTVISMQWLRTPRIQRLLDEVLPSATDKPGFFDLLIVDEAHHCAPPAPSRRRGYAVDSDQTRAVHRLGGHSTHRLFLSATPHNGYPESWQALLEMLDPQRFLRGAEPDPTVVAEVMVCRLKDTIVDADGSPRFPLRSTRAVEVAYTDEEKEGHHLLEDYAAARRRTPGMTVARLGDLITLLLKKRLFSSPAAFAHTLDAHAGSLQRAATPTPGAHDEALPDWLAEALAWDDEPADDATVDDLEGDLLDRTATLLGDPNHGDPNHGDQRGRPASTAPRRPLHWPLAFPEVFADTPDPGFDAIIGNPPFLGGQKISGHLGDDYRRWLQTWDGGSVKGSADVVAFFVLRARRLLSRRGQLGYIATNTLVQGDTLQVGLLQAVSNGLVIRRGRSSHKWPSASANLEIVDLWASRAPLQAVARCWLDGEDVPHVGSDLEPVSAVIGRPKRLAENDDIAFQGSNVLGLGFTLTHESAADMIRRDPRNADVIQPYVIGKDLNQHPDCSASRHIINFRDWPLERAEQYPDAIEVVRRLVKPERARNKRTQRRDRWWTYAERAPELYEAIAKLDHVLAISLVGNALLPVRVPTGPVFAHKCAVFALDDFGSLALLSSSAHATWVIRYTSTMRTDINYSPSDVFRTFPRPRSTTQMAELGERLDSERRELMLSRAWGLTTTYNHVHDPTDTDPAVVALRDLHAGIDRATFAAYGWDDLDPEIGHHPTKIGTRWTVSPVVRFEILDRLLAENHRRHAAEHGR